MSLQIGNTWDDGYGRTYMELANPKQTGEVYVQQREFWRRRLNPEGAEFPEEYLKDVISNQTPDYGKPSHAALATFLNDLVAERMNSRAADISVIEIGAANGPTPRHFQRFHPDIKLTYFGMEVFPALMQDGQEQFPEHRFVLGTAEDFIELAPEAMGQEKFDAFMASLVLCMMPTELAYKVLSKASEMTDTILCRDYLTNKGGEVSRTKAVLFEMAPGHSHLLFANQFELMLRSLGFSRIDYIFEESAGADLRGMGTFLAQRTRS